jgi:hypothetical protein
LLQHSDFLLFFAIIILGIQELNVKKHLALIKAKKNLIGTEFTSWTSLVNFK